MTNRKNINLERGRGQSSEKRKKFLEIGSQDELPHESERLCHVRKVLGTWASFFRERIRVKRQPLSLTPRKKNLRLMSNKSNNVISLAMLSQGNLKISCQKPHKNVTAPRALWFDATREFPSGMVLREIAQQDKKMLQQGQRMPSQDSWWKIWV